MLEPEDLPSDGYWHVAIYVKGRYGWITQYDMSKEILFSTVVYPYRASEELLVSGNRILKENITTIKISHTDNPANSFSYLDNGFFRLYKNLFDNAPNSKDYSVLLTRYALGVPLVPDPKCEERVASINVKVEEAQNKKLEKIQVAPVVINNYQIQEQQQVVSTVNNYQDLYKLIELYADLMKQLKQQNIPKDLLEEAKGVQDLLDSLSKNSDKDKVVGALRKVKRVMDNLKEIAVDTKDVIMSLNWLSHLFGL